MRIASLMIVAALLAGAGCKSTVKSEAKPPPRYVQLPIDPDNPPVAVGWWSNGREIACVHQSGLYVVLPYPDPNAPPVEYGRWSRDSYAFIWLEPYNSRSYEKVRAAFRAEDDAVALLFPKLDPMYPTDDIGQVQWPAPPRSEVR